MKFRLTFAEVPNLGRITIEDVPIVLDGAPLTVEQVQAAFRGSRWQAHVADITVTEESPGVYLVDWPQYREWQNAMTPVPQPFEITPTIVCSAGIAVSLTVQDWTEGHGFDVVPSQPPTAGEWLVAGHHVSFDATPEQIGTGIAAINSPVVLEGIEGSLQTKVSFNWAARTEFRSVDLRTLVTFTFEQLPEPVVEPPKPSLVIEGRSLANWQEFDAFGAELAARAGELWGGR
jgi:hypothetical protein